MTATVSVIIPTTAELGRRESLLRAIDSVLTQQGVATDLVVVANGVRCDEALLQVIEKLPVRIVRLREASLPSAIHAGRLSVKNQYFSFLDDDDIYLPDALSRRLDALHTGVADFAVSNGINAGGGLVIPDIRRVENDPLRALMTRNWLASCGGLYRTESIPAELFHELVKYLEWTVLSFRLLMAGKKVCFVDQVTFQISETEGSASKQRSMESLQNAVAVVDYMFTHAPAEVCRGLSWKRASTYHEFSNYCLRSNRMSQAWWMHWLSIRRGGWQYVLYTRHLLWQPCKAWVAVLMSK